MSCHILNAGCTRAMCAVTAFMWRIAGAVWDFASSAFCLGFVRTASSSVWDVASSMWFVLSSMWDVASCACGAQELCGLLHPATLTLTLTMKGDKRRARNPKLASAATTRFLGAALCLSQC